MPSPGTSGHLGRFAIKQLLARGVPPSHVVAVVRTRGKATSLAGRGVQVREGDYFRPETLGAALADANRLLLVPSSEQSAVLHKYPWRPCGENARICRRRRARPSTPNGARIGEDALRPPTPHGLPGWCAVSHLTTTLTAMTWSSGWRSSIRSSFPARGVETQDHLDDRALPDRLRSLHRHLDGH
jgi:hypothetical protein